MKFCPRCGKVATEVAGTVTKWLCGTHGVVAEQAAPAVHQTAKSPAVEVKPSPAKSPAVEVKPSPAKSPAVEVKPSPAKSPATATVSYASGYKAK
jgi:uncharacterized Zn finger protein (UPF0148 family)